MPVQALAMMNNSLVIRSSKVFAERLDKEAGAGFDDRVRRAYELHQDLQGDPSKKTRHKLNFLEGIKTRALKRHER